MDKLYDETRVREVPVDSEEHDIDLFYLLLTRSESDQLVS